MTETLQLLEIQGTAEGGQFSRQQLNQMLEATETGFYQLLVAQTS